MLSLKWGSFFSKEKHLGKKSGGSLALLILMTLGRGLSSLRAWRGSDFLLGVMNSFLKSIKWWLFRLQVDFLIGLSCFYFIIKSLLKYIEHIKLTQSCIINNRITIQISFHVQKIIKQAITETRYFFCRIVASLIKSQFQQSQQQQYIHLVQRFPKMMLNNLTLDNFNMLSVIGKGSYAKVVLVKKKGENNDTVYAMKILKKKYIEKRKQETHVMTERNILVGMDHPFIVKLYYSFQNQKKLFFALQYCPGGQLFGLLSKKHRLSQQITKFYVAQIILALQYLHSRDIIYRDLKPENILIDQVGYLRLTDFGLSKMDITESNAFSVCGTPQYLAPEILYKQGHGKPVDWWCLGSLIYEMIVGLPPFYSKSRPQLFDKIKFSNPNIPNHMSKNLKSLLQLLFQKKPENRLGSKGGAQQIKKHPWFEGINWQMIYQKKIKAPFIPLVKSYSDVSNFDPQFTQCPVESFSEASFKSQQGKPYDGFSFNKSKDDKMDFQGEGEEGELEIQINETHEAMEEEM